MGGPVQLSQAVVNSVRTLLNWKGIPISGDPDSGAGAVYLVDSAGVAVTGFTTNDPGIPDTLGQKTMAGSTSVAIASDQSAVPVNDVGLPDTLGQKTMAGSTGVTMASDQPAIKVDPTPAGTYSQSTNVASSAAAVAILAANAARKGGIVSNDSTAKLYLLLDASGSTEVTAAVFTYVVPAGSTLELPVPVFQGRIRGIWAAANGSAGVTEIT